MRTLLLVLMLMLANVSEATATRSENSQLSIIPLDSTMQRMWQSTDFKDHLEIPNQAEKTFHEKSKKAYLTLSNELKGQDLDAFIFIADCRFLSRQALSRKYSHLRLDWKVVQKKVDEAFAQ